MCAWWVILIYLLHMDIKAFVPGVVIALIVGIGLGGYFGKNIGYEEARSEFGSLLDIAYPPPPAVAYRLSGDVGSVVGGTIGLNVDDPDDYLPHPDGSPRVTQLRQVGVRVGTELVLLDYLNPNESGSPMERVLELSEIQAGDRLIVESEENIRDEENFVATRIEKILF